MPSYIRVAEDVIAAEIASWEIPFVHLDVFGTADSAAIAEQITTFVRVHLKRSIRGHTFCTASVGSTHGLVLDDGTRVVLKARPAQSTNPDLPLDARSLECIARVQSFLAERAYPAPRPLVPPAPLGQGLATIETHLADGDPADAHEPRVRGVIVRELHRQIALLRDFEDSDRSLLRHFAPPDGRLFPQPHSKLFDIDATKDEAGWIEDLARRSRTLAESVASPALLAHCDFRAEHLRFDGDRVVATYDWDSVALRSEVAVVGVTAQGFTADWSQDDLRRTPTEDEIVAFIDEYSRARELPLSGDEHRAARAWAVYWVAYGARISIRPGEVDWPHDSWAGLLRTSGEDLLV